MNPRRHDISGARCWCLDERLVAITPEPRTSPDVAATEEEGPTP